MSGKKVKVGGGGGGEGRRMTTRSMANEVKDRCLMNHLVLETVFEYCSVKDLKVVRQVSPLWRDCARKKWNKSVKLSISRVAEWSSDESGKEKYQQFLQMVESDQPFLETGSRGNWTTFCAQVKTLELDCVILPTVQSLQNALFRCFPNLESLILYYIANRRDGHVSSVPTGPVTEDQHQRNLKLLIVCIGDAEFPLSWMEVLSHFPSLEGIEVTAPTTHTETIFQAINQIREEDPSKLNLTHVSSWYITPAAITTLMDRRLQLESLDLLLMGLNDRDVFRDILQVHARTLKTLTFEKEEDVPFPQGYGFPQLTELQELRMTLFSSPESIEFLKFTPNLRKLTLQSYNLGDLQVPETNFDGFPIMLNACKVLEIRDCSMSLSTENWKALIEWTPNLESLKIYNVDNAKFSMICEGWTKLVELYLVGWTEVDGSGITGWDEEDVYRFDSMWSSKRRARAASSGSRPITVPRANIAGLKNLQIFKMIASSRIRLGRAAGLHGIEMLPDLRRLCIRNYEMLDKDRDYWKKLQERYPFPE